MHQCRNNNFEAFPEFLWRLIGVLYSSPETKARLRRWSPQWRKDATPPTHDARPGPVAGFPDPWSIGSLVGLKARARSKVPSGADQFCRGFSGRPTPSSAPAPADEPRPGPAAGFPDPRPVGSLVGPKARARSKVSADAD